MRRLRLPRRDVESTIRSPTVAKTNSILSGNELRSELRSGSRQQVFESESDRFPFFTVELRAACEQPHTPFLRYAAETAGRINYCTSFRSCLLRKRRTGKIYIIMYCIIASLVDHEISPPTLHIATVPKGRIQTKYHNKLVLCNQSLDPTNLTEERVRSREVSMIKS